MASFLSKYRVGKGHEFTHTSLSRPAGSFYVPASSSDEFMGEYCRALLRGDELHVTERHRHIGPVVVDLDFRYPPSAPSAASDASGSAGVSARRHGPALVRSVVELYARCISSLVAVPASESGRRTFDCYVLEKPGPTVGRDAEKDGLHLEFPSVVTRASVQHLLRSDVLPGIGPVLRAALPELTNPVEDVVDEAVIEKNNWMMYGSRKPGGEPYAVTSVYRHDADTGETALLEGGVGVGGPEAMVQLLSIRNKYDELSVEATQVERVEALEARREDERLRREAVQSVLAPASNSRRNVCQDMEMVSKLVGILAPRRVESYTDWVRLGWCLRNIDHRLLDTWIEASKRSSKYIDGECQRLWNSMRHGGLGPGTLHMWARSDSPEEYRELLRIDLSDLIKSSVSGAHYDVARVVHHLYRYEFACSSLRNRTWWEFRQHRWRECDQGYSLRMRLSTDVFKEYLSVKTRVTQHATAIDDDGMQKDLLLLSKKLADLALKLKVTSFKENVMKECSELFYQEKFEDKLNSDVDLVGFENGVYDLSRFEFRDGRPDDYVSFSTGISYIPFSPEQPVVAEIRRFWESVHPDPCIREYVLTTLASCLSGRVRDERFHIWTGSGSNGKSLSVSLFEKTFGDYCCKFPITLMTQKRTASSSATPEIARAKGRRFAVLQEPSEDERLNVGQLKELSGGDVVQTRELFKSPCEWRPQFKLFLLCNQLPVVPSDDGGTWRRIRVVEFASKFVEYPSPNNPREFPVDLDLGHKIENWKEHFMAMLIDYYKIYISRPLEEPPSVTSCTREYQRTNDHMADFVDSSIEAHDSSLLRSDEVFEEFKEWIKRENVPLKNAKRSALQKYIDRSIGKHNMVNGRVVWKGARIRDRFAASSSEDGGGNQDGDL